MFKKIGAESTWERAKFLAKKRGGHLATINSKGENTFVVNLIKKRKYWYYLKDGFEKIDFWDGPWIGGYQVAGSEEPSGGWKWVTNEPFRFTAWHRGNPDDLFGGATQQNRLHYWDKGSVKKFEDVVPAWDDVREGTYWIPAFVVEYERKPAVGTFSSVFSWFPADGSNFHDSVCQGEDAP